MKVLLERVSILTLTLKCLSLQMRFDRISTFIFYKLDFREVVMKVGIACTYFWLNYEMFSSSFFHFPSSVHRTTSDPPNSTLLHLFWRINMSPCRIDAASLWADKSVTLIWPLKCEWETSDLHVTNCRKQAAEISRNLREGETDASSKMGRKSIGDVWVTLSWNKQTTAPSEDLVCFTCWP